MPEATVVPSSVNLNSYVWIKLTDIGAQQFPVQVAQAKREQNGWVRYQLWELMNIFGPAMYNGADVTIADNTLYFTKPEDA